MISTKYWLPVIVTNFLIAGCYGAIMRLAFVTELSWIDYRNLMHGHSHVAMLGWLYLSLFLLMIFVFVPNQLKSKRYQTLFLLTEICVIGMAIAFPLQGYGTYAIIFSTAHVFLSYYFIYTFLKDLRLYHPSTSPAVLMAKTALFFMILSTLALFTMAPIMMLDLKSTNLYYMAVQFFLHFQFNGWFIFGILAVIFKIFEKSNIVIPKGHFRKFYWILTSATCLTYALAVTWSNPSPLLFLLNSTGVLLQLVALFYLIKMLLPAYPLFKKQLSRPIHWLFVIGFVGLSIKMLVQFAVVIPYLGKIAYTIRNYVIGFIHLILLGAITFLIFAVATHLKMINIQKFGIKWGLVILFAGVFLSELILFLQGTFLWVGFGFIPYYYEVIFGVSLLMPVGVLFILTGVLSKPRSGTLV